MDIPNGNWDVLKPLSEYRKENGNQDVLKPSSEYREENGNWDVLKPLSEYREENGNWDVLKPLGEYPGNMNIRKGISWKHEHQKLQFAHCSWRFANWNQFTKLGFTKNIP